MCMYIYIYIYTHIWLSLCVMCLLLLPKGSLHLTGHEMGETQLVVKGMPRSPA